MALRISIINYSDSLGGAARAAYRLHRALLGSGVDSKMLVNNARTGDRTVEGPQSVQARVLARLKRFTGGLLTKVLRTGNPILHSPAVMPTRWAARLNSSAFDVVHLNWINYEMMSISDIGRIRKPLVWTLHDMWAFCGAEHVTEEFRWRDGYLRDNRPDYESGFDLNRWTWSRKRKHWTRPFHIVAPSHWLANCVQESNLMRDWPVSVVPNAIDTDVWRPVERRVARELLGLPPDIPLILFGAIGGGKEPHKGFDLLLEALRCLQGKINGLQLSIFGQSAPKELEDVGCRINYLGHVHDDISLRLIYSSANALIIPSRRDNLPNTGVEAHACGVPVVAFDTCGLPDIVCHRKTGYLAKAFDPEDLAHGIAWVVSDAKRNMEMGLAARENAVARYSYPVVADQYVDVYKKIISSDWN